jgi:hypothetical protein
MSEQALRRSWRGRARWNTRRCSRAGIPRVACAANERDHELDRLRLVEAFPADERPPRLEVDRVPERGEERRSPAAARAPAAGEHVAHRPQACELPPGEPSEGRKGVEVAQDVGDLPLVACVVAVELGERDAESPLGIGDAPPGLGIRKGIAGRDVRATLRRLHALAEAGAIEKLKSPKTLIYISMLWQQHSRTLVAVGPLRVAMWVFARVGRLLGYQLPARRAAT